MHHPDPYPPAEDAEDPPWAEAVEDEPAPAPRPAAAGFAPCQGCGELVARRWPCPVCGAPPRPIPRAVPVRRADDTDWAALADDPPPRRRRRRPPLPPLTPLFVGYGALIGILLLFLGLTVAVVRGGAGVTEAEQHWALAGMEVVTTLLVGVVALATGALPVRRAEPGPRVAAWALGFPALAGLLALNLGFIYFVRELFRVPVEPGPGLTWVTLLLVCVQPALVEEWFFRHIALGALRPRLGRHAAVWVTAIMFGAAHLMNPIGVPYLILAGAFLGYMRVWSGGMALPVLLHFAHNAAVLVASQWA